MNVTMSIQSVLAWASRRKPGYVAAVLAAATENNGVMVSMTTEAHEGIREKFAFCGPGCQLRRTLSWWRIRDDGSCGCGDYAAYMDRLGPDGCAAKIDEIVAHLVEQAAKRSVILGAIPSVVVVPLVRRAIDAARQEVAHGQASTEKEARADLVRPG